MSSETFLRKPGEQELIPLPSPQEIIETGSTMFPTKPPRYPLFHSAIAEYRKQYFSFYFIYVFLLILLMWALLPIYWASLAYTTQHTQKLSVWVVDFDHSTIGNGVVAAVQRALDNADSAPTLGWQIVNSSDSMAQSNEKIMDNIVDEKTWAAVVINANATDTLLSMISGDLDVRNTTAISVYYNEARNEFAADFYIVPFVNTLLIPTISEITANITSHFLTSNVGNETALNSFAKAASAVSSGTANGGSVTYELVNLRPFSAPVVSALTEVGMILITIFSFILTMANSALRLIIARHLRLSYYVMLRIFVPMLAYIPLSLSFATISLPFHAPFNTKYTEAQGFGLFWIICYILMCSLGLATEFAIGVLTIRFAPFFLLTLIITNVSVTEFPLGLLPGIFHYGRGFPFFNASQAFRTIAFNTKSHLSANIPILIAWMLVSMLTVGLSTWIIEGRKRRNGTEETEAHH